MPGVAMNQPGMSDPAAKPQEFAFKAPTMAP
jgi:hypothetical protein